MTMITNLYIYKTIYPKKSGVNTNDFIFHYFNGSIHLQSVLNLDLKRKCKNNAYFSGVVGGCG